MNTPKTIDEILDMIIHYATQQDRSAGLSRVQAKQALAEWVRSKRPLIPGIKFEDDLQDVAVRMGKLDAISAFEQALIADLEESI